MNRYRPALMANYGANLNLNQQRRAVVNRHLKDDGDAADAGIMELYHRYNLPYEGSDGVASPDDHDEVTEDLLASANGKSNHFSIKKILIIKKLMN